MRFLLSILLVATLGYLAGIFLPWWSIALVAFIVCLFFHARPGYGFLSGFLGIFILWCLVALWWDLPNDSILSSKVAQLFMLGESPVLLILVTGLVGGLVGGFAGMAGSSVRAFNQKN